MKLKVLITAFTMLFALQLVHAQIPEPVNFNDTGYVVGGAGFIKMFGNPNKVEKLALIDQRYSGSFAWDTTTNTLYQYNPYIGSGTRWTKTQTVKYTNGAPGIGRDTAFKFYADTVNRQLYVCNTSGCVVVGGGSSVTASNGLTLALGDVKLGGVLTQAATITTSGSNQLKIVGMQGGSVNDSFVVADALTGALRRRTFNDVMSGAKRVKKYTEGSVNVIDTALYALQQWGKTYSYFDSSANKMVKIDKSTLSIIDFGGIEGLSSQSAIWANNAAMANSLLKVGYLFIPKGVFYCDTTINLHSGQTAFGINRDSSILNYRGNTYCITAIDSVGCSHIMIRDFQILKDLTSPAAIGAIWVRNAVFSHITDMFINEIGAGFLNRGSIIYTSDLRTGRGNGSDCTIERNMVYSSGGASILLDAKGYGGANIWIANNLLEAGTEGIRITNPDTVGGTRTPWNAINMVNNNAESCNKPFNIESCINCTATNSYAEQVEGNTNPCFIFSTPTGGSVTNFRINGATLNGVDVSTALIYALSNQVIGVEVNDVIASEGGAALANNIPLVAGPIENLVIKNPILINFYDGFTNLFTSTNDNNHFRTKVILTQNGHGYKNGASNIIIPEGESYWNGDSLTMSISNKQVRYYSTDPITAQLRTGGTNDSIIVSNNNTFKKILSPNLSNWNLLGNSGTNATSNFIGNTDSVKLTFRTNNLARMTISAAGNIGIGVTSPNYSLDVGGISYLGGGIIFASTKTIESGGTWNAYSGNGQYTFRNNLNQSMISVNGQNVGIGINTTSPSYRLDVDAKTGSAGNPIRAQGFIHSSSIDSLLGYRTANSGVVERTTAQLVVSKVFSDSCVNTSISLTAIGAASAAGATVNYGRSIQLPQIQLTARSSNSINPVTAYASSVTSTGFIANAYNLGGSAVDATIDIKVCPNGGSGY